MAKTPAIVACERAGIPHRVLEYAHEPSQRSFGLEAAERLGLDPDQVFKTLVADLDGRLVVAVVPVSGSLDVKALAAALGGKKADLADPKLAERKTGYIVGGISPVGQKTTLQTCIDETAQLFDVIYVSAGARGMDLEISPDDLQSLTGAMFADIARLA